MILKISELTKTLGTCSEKKRPLYLAFNFTYKYYFEMLCFRNKIQSKIVRKCLNLFFVVDNKMKLLCINTLPE